jgi:hypothetical protein
VAEDAVEEVVAEVEDTPVVETREDDAAAEEEPEKLPAQEEPTKVEPEPAPKPVRLTRRQQAKLEEELKQSRREEPSSPQTVLVKDRVEEVKEETPEEVVVEEQVEAEAESEQLVVEGTLIEKPVEDEPVEDEQEKQRPALQETANEQSSPQEDAIAEPQQNEAKPEILEQAHAQVTESLKSREIEDASNESVETKQTTAIQQTQTEAHIEGSLPDEVTPSVEVTSEPEPKMLTAEKPYEATLSTPMKNHNSNRRASRSASKSPMRIEESISAIDRLEEDLEDIGKAIPNLNQSDDEKSPRKARSVETDGTPIARLKPSSKTPAKAPAKVSARTPAKIASKAPSKTPVKAPVVAKAPPPTKISRVPNAAPKSVKPTTSSLARASSVRTIPSKDVRKPSTETADYLASKRRPISLSFPTPPPPPKGRAPTKSTFQLSSENVAAKLRAQKEERLKREAEGVSAPKQRPISMPPPPKSTKPPTVPSFQLPGEATAARLKAQKEERLKRMEEGAQKPTTRPTSIAPPAKSTKQLTKPSFQLPGEATAARLKAQKEERLKRMEEAEAAKKAALAAPVRKPIAHRPRESLLVKDAPGISILPPSKLDAPQRSSSLASKRSSIIGPSASRSTSTSSANRNSLLLTAGAKSTVTPVDAVALKVKGKQVFNRDKVEKEERERERKEKEEAAKKARAEAAERGRIASREWAERQRKKLMGQ